MVKREARAVGGGGGGGVTLLWLRKLKNKFGSSYCRAPRYDTILCDLDLDSSPQECKKANSFVPAASQSSRSI